VNATLDTCWRDHFWEGVKPLDPLNRPILMGDRRSSVEREILMLKLMGDRPYFMVHRRIKLLEYAGAMK
jgi:hypothetical protein